MASISGHVFDIQRYSIHDGPGIRTTVFLKGCPLRCQWCHNPESLEQAAVVSYDASLCIACGRCVAACSREAHTLLHAGHEFDRSRCAQEPCGGCVEACPSQALELRGSVMSVSDVMAKVLRDREFFEYSGGGMTLSGGEPAAQPEFSVHLLARAKAAGLHTVLDTSGYGDREVFERMIPHTDLFLFDIKADPDRHEECTGVPLNPIRENLVRLCRSGARVAIRLPLVPGYNVTEAHFRNVAELYRECPQVESVNVLPFHRLARSKYSRIGKKWSILSSVSAPSRATVEGWINRLKALGVPATAHWTGPPDFTSGLVSLCRR